MWIVKIALSRPYTFIVLALLIFLIAPVIILRTPTDIFPNIDIPVISIIWQFNGMNPEELEGRITTVFERTMATLVNDIEHIESTTLNGSASVKVYLQPNASVEAGVAQVVAASQNTIKNLPPGTNPPLVLQYNATTVPIIQLSLSSDTLTEQALNDLGQNFLRPQLVTVPGAAIPYPYGGKQRQIAIDLDPAQIQAKGLSPFEILSALSNQNLLLPSGTAKMGQFEYDIRMNTAPRTVAQINALPIKVVNGATIYLSNVAHARDGFAPQTNIVRQDGRHGVLMSVFKSGNASTLNIVSGVRKALPTIQSTLPPELKIQPLADQSIFVRAAINGVVREAVIAACLTGLMILLFLASWRSTLIIAISIPLSILASIIVLSALHETINIMTLGGLALAVGILVDDATVEIENVNRILEEGQETDVKQAILDGAQQIAVPALVATLCICIVFLPMFFLSGVAKYLFVPLAEAVVFAMLASYILSRTLVPTLAMYLLRIPDHQAAHRPTRNPLVLFQRSFERLFEKARLRYQEFLAIAIRRRAVFVPLFLLLCLSAALLIPVLGQDFFPSSDAGQLRLHVRAKTGTRIEEMARLCDKVETAIRREIPAGELETILDNIGLPFSTINLSYSNSGQIGTADADVLISLNEKHHPVADYQRLLRLRLRNEFPGVTFYFLPADMVTQILNFGLPAPIDVQIVGNVVAESRKFADRLLPQLKQILGTVDLHIHQVFDEPSYNLQVDRVKAANIGYTQNDVARSVLISLSGSFQTAPTFWLNFNNGVSYNMVAQTPQYAIQSLSDLRNIPITGSSPLAKPEILSDVADIHRASEPGVVTHYNIRRTIDIYGAAQGRDMGGVARDIQRVLDRNSNHLPRGTQVALKGQAETMRQSFTGLLAGLVFSIVLVYFLIVVNFQSWLDPFIIITALPAALAGILLFLFLTRTTLSVPALMGAIMCMGVATANSILVVSFARDRLAVHGSATEAALEAGSTRFRPVIMTATAMIIGMVPMALGLGEGGEQNAPLGRAVIGGLLFATIATLIFVPAVFSLIHGAGKDKTGYPEESRA
jgi:multidrug efflux pump subunit AcrB